MKLLYFGPLDRGSTSQQRADAFARLPGLDVVALDTRERAHPPTLVDRVRGRLGRPRDRLGLMTTLEGAVRAHAPDFVLVDSVRVLAPERLARLRRDHGVTLAYYSPDDVSQRWNSSRTLEAADALWDVFFTTKTFNVPELRARGVRNPVLAGNAFDPDVHRPMNPGEAGPDFERWECVFVGTCEPERLRSLNRLAVERRSVVVWGNGWRRDTLHPAITLRPAVYDLDYTRALHSGKLALGFLRHLNRDRITTRSIEIPAAARPLVAERTEEHDAHLAPGEEYAPFTTDDTLVEAVRGLLDAPDTRARLAAAGRARCLRSGYDVVSRAREQLEALRAARSGAARG